MIPTVSRRSALLTVTVLGAVLACSPKDTAPLSPAALVVFPPPPDTARVQFLARITGERDIREERTSFWDRLVGEDESQVVRKEILKPYGLGVGNGKIYVCDTRLPGLEVIDLEKRTFEYFNPSGPGRLRQPFNCFVDKSDDLLYVADLGRREIVVFDDAGEYLHTIGNPEGIRPSDVFVRDGRVWVSDLENGEIEVYDKATRALIATLPDVQRGDSGSLSILATTRSRSTPSTASSSHPWGVMVTRMGSLPGQRVYRSIVTATSMLWMRRSTTCKSSIETGADV
jgi:hypothetical protein